MSVKSKSVLDLVSRTRAMQGELEESIRSLREEIASLKEDREHLALRPVAIEEANARADEFANHLKDEAGRNMRFSVADLAAGPKFFSKYKVKPELFSNLALMFVAPQIADFLKARVQEHYASIASGAPITLEERQKAAARLDQRIMDAELAEESIIRVAERGGFPVLRRADANPAAILAADSELP